MQNVDSSLVNQAFNYAGGGLGSQWSVVHDTIEGVDLSIKSFEMKEKAGGHMEVTMEVYNIGPSDCDDEDMEDRDNVEGVPVGDADARYEADMKADERKSDIHDLIDGHHGKNNPAYGLKKDAGKNYNCKSDEPQEVYKAFGKVQAHQFTFNKHNDSGDMAKHPLPTLYPLSKSDIQTEDGTGNKYFTLRFSTKEPGNR